MRLRWTPEAAANLEDIYSYLGEHYPQFADSTITTRYEGIESLTQFPAEADLAARQAFANSCSFDCRTSWHIELKRKRLKFCVCAIRRGSGDSYRFCSMREATVLMRSYLVRISKRASPISTKTAGFS